jgi:hypothetical protein
MLLMKSCKGFLENSFHMLCCNGQKCGKLYTQSAVEDLGYELKRGLEYMTCHDSEPSGTTPAAAAVPNKESNGPRKTVIASVVSVAVLLLIGCASVMVFLVRRRMSASAELPMSQVRVPVFWCQA